MQFDKDDRRFWQRYTANEAARFLGMSRHTLRGWFCEAPGCAPLFGERARREGEDFHLSFAELVEAHVANRYIELGVSEERLRQVRPFLLETIDPDHPFAARAFLFRGSDQLHKFSLEHPADCEADAMAVYEQWYEGSRSGTWRHLPKLVEALDQLDYDPVSPRSLAYRFHPYGTDIPIVIFPPCGSGRLTVKGENLLAEILAGQYRRGETVEAIADDYELPEDVVRLVVTSLSPS